MLHTQKELYLCFDFKDPSELMKNCIELMVEIPIKLKKACVTLSMGASNFLS